jgi:hypothetical protein
VTFYLSNAQVRPVGNEAAEFIDVSDDSELSGSQRGELFLKARHGLLEQEDRPAQAGDSEGGDLLE